MPRDLTAYPDIDAGLDEMGKVLMRAADIVERGWCKGNFWSREASPHLYPHDLYCMMGAIITATGTMIPSSSAANAVTMISIQRTLSPYVERLGFPSSADAYDWNDRQPCSAPVVARMRQAAKAPIPVPPCFFVELEPPSKEMLQLLDAISGQPIS